MDVVVVGGGVAGTSTAYHLAKAGVKTLLLERDHIAAPAAAPPPAAPGAPGGGVGFSPPPMRQPFDETVHFRGEQTARRIWEFALRSVSGLGALLESRGAASETGLDLSGGHVLADARSLHAVEQSYRALERAGFPIEWLSGERVRA